MDIRALFNDGDSDPDKHVCHTQSLDGDATTPFIGSMSFYTFNKILSGSCAAFSCVVIFVLMILHATHLSKSNEQIKILRIFLLIPFWSIISFLNVCFPKAEVYLTPWLEFVQAICLGTFFLLLCEFVSPSRKHRDVFFAALEVKNKKSSSNKQSGLQWYQRMWFSIFQYPVVSLLVAILTDITEAVDIYCQFESSPHFAKLWLNLIGKISLAVAVIAVLNFFMQLKADLVHHKPMAKFVAFKLVVFLTFIEGIVFWILEDVDVMKPTSTLTWADLHIGIPSLLICIEMVPLSIFFHYAYTYQPYVIGSQQLQRPLAGDVEAYMPQSYQGELLGWAAFLEMWNPKEIIEAIGFGIKMRSESTKRRGDQSRAGGGVYEPVGERYGM